MIKLLLVAETDVDSNSVAGGCRCLVESFWLVDIDAQLGGRQEYLAVGELCPQRR